MQFNQFIIFGGCGFIGTHTANLLREKYPDAKIYIADLLADGTENLGHSMILDYEGKILDEIDEIEGGIYAEVNLQKMYEFREKCTILEDIKDEYKVINK